MGQHKSAEKLLPKRGLKALGNLCILLSIIHGRYVSEKMSSHNLASLFDAQLGFKFVTTPKLWKTPSPEY